MSSKNAQCETFLPLLDAYVDNELDGSEKEQVASHVQSCDDCKGQIKEIETLKVSLSSLPRRQMKRDLADSLDAVLGAAEKTPSSELAATSSLSDSNVVPIRSKRRWVVAAASAAAILVVAMAGSFVSKGGQQIAVVDKNSQPIAQSNTPIEKNLQALVTKEFGTNSSQASSMQNDDEQKTIVANDNGSSAKSIHLSELQPGVAQKSDGQRIPAAAGKDGEEPKTAGAHMTGAQEDNFKTTVVAHDESSEAVRGRPATGELLALYEDDDDSSDIGVMTDEDGLYAIKL